MFVLCYTLKSNSTAIILNLLLKEIRVLFLKVQKTFSSKRLAMWVLSICPSILWCGSRCWWFLELWLRTSLCIAWDVWEIVQSFLGVGSSSRVLLVCLGEFWSWICFVQRHLCWLLVLRSTESRRGVGFRGCLFVLYGKRTLGPCGKVLLHVIGLEIWCLWWMCLVVCLLLC